MTDLEPVLNNQDGDMSSTLDDQKVGPELLPETKQPPDKQECNTIANEEDEFEPLGFQHYLYDVDIEYSPGGDKASAAGNRHIFKMKYLPYMVQGESNTTICKSSLASSNSSICAPKTPQDDSILDTSLNSSSIPSPMIDVTKTSCAFLGNSDYVPCDKSGKRRVILEMISAKLSQSSSFNVPNNTSYKNLVTLAEMSSSLPPEASFINDSRQGPSSNRGTHEISRTSTGTHGHLNLSPNNHPNQLAPSSLAPVPVNSSKRFVNYTILIKTAPGLDRHPAVIERRFSDFLQLYQGLKSNTNHARIVDKYVNFPKKVYMGNFSLTNIAERSIEFSRLLDLCMTKSSLLWSRPFVSFLLDKELKEAHKLSLCGDPDDVQALIETAYYIEKKLYLDYMQSSSDSNSNQSMDLFAHLTDRYSPSLPNGRAIIDQSPSNDTISATSSFSEHNNYLNNPNQNGNNRPHSTDSNGGSNLNKSTSNGSDSLDSFRTISRSGYTPLNQRILVTFCMLFIAYYRGENYLELRTVVQGFSQLIASQEYVDTIVNTRHYSTLRACLLFLMNMNRGNVVDNEMRLFLKRRLEDIDGFYANINEPILTSTMNSPVDASDLSSSNRSPISRKRVSVDSQDSSMNNNNLGVFRITRGDLTSLIRDENFCSF